MCGDGGRHRFGLAQERPVQSIRGVNASWVLLTTFGGRGRAGDEATQFRNPSTFSPCTHTDTPKTTSVTRIKAPHMSQSSGKESDLAAKKTHLTSTRSMDHQRGERSAHMFGDPPGVYCGPVALVGKARCPCANALEATRSCPEMQSFR